MEIFNGSALNAMHLKSRMMRSQKEDSDFMFVVIDLAEYIVGAQTSL